MPFISKFVQSNLKILGFLGCASSSWLVQPLGSLFFLLSTCFLTFQLLCLERLFSLFFHQNKFMVRKKCLNDNPVEHFIQVFVVLLFLILLRFVQLSQLNQCKCLSVQLRKFKLYLGYFYSLLCTVKPVQSITQPPTLLAGWKGSLGTCSTSARNNLYNI